MAAPCGRMASRSFLTFLSTLTKTPARHNKCRFFSTTLCRATFRTQAVTERDNSPWTLMAAVCLQRLPVISADCTTIEAEFRQMLSKMELEKSLLSDHELQLLEDAERMSRKQGDDYDSDEEGSHRGQEIVLAQDLEDSWEQKLKNFEMAPRLRPEVDKDVASVERCLADSLILLAEQQVGDEKLWLLPQTQWREGETLRQTAERALASLPDAAFKATFLGNAPCGVYKYKLPRAVRTEGSAGIKVFFFKAVLADRRAAAAAHTTAAAATATPFMWLKRSELERYLKPAYMRKVEQFSLGL